VVSPVVGVVGPAVATDGGTGESVPAATAGPAERVEGRLNHSTDTDVHRFEPAANASGVTLRLAGPAEADFDLYATVDGRTPSPEDFDARATSDDANETLSVPAEDVDDLAVAVVSVAGEGNYSLTASGVAADGTPRVEWFDIGDRPDLNRSPRISELAPVRALANVSHPDGDDLTLEWTVTGAFDRTGDSGANTTVETDDPGLVSTKLYPTDDGTATVELRVIDGDGDTTTATRTVTVENDDPTGTLWGPDRASVDQRVSFRTVLTDAAGDDLALDLSVSGGEVVASNVTERSVATGDVRHTGEHVLQFTDEGEQTVTVTARDGDGGVLDLNRTVSVGDGAPTVDLSSSDRLADGDATAGTTAAIRAFASGETLSYDWSVSGDADLVDGDGTDTARVEFLADREPADDDTATVSVTVTDADGRTATDSVTLDVVERAPGVPEVTDLRVGEQYREGQGFYPGVDAIPRDDQSLTYEWTVEGPAAVDRSDSYGNAPSITALDEGTVSLTVAVTDPDGNTANRTATTEVVDSEPFLAVDLPDQVGVGDAVELGVRGSVAPDDVANYSALLPEHATVLEDRVERTGPHDGDLRGHLLVRFDERGEYEAGLALADGDGDRTRDVESVTVAAGVPPEVSFPGPEPVTVEEGSTHTVAVAASDPDGDALTYDWSVSGVHWDVETPVELVETDGDRATVRVGSPAPSYSDGPGPYVTVAVAVSDGNNTVHADKNLAVDNVAPTVGEVEGPQSVSVDGVANYTVDATDPVDDLAYDWSVENATLVRAEGDAASVRFDTPGRASVSVTVADDETTTTAETTVRVGSDPAAVTFEDRRIEPRQDTLVVDSATLPNGGFVAVHDSTLRTQNDPLGSVRGTSTYLPPGTHHDVRVDLSDSFTASDTAVAMAVRDTDGDETYEFVASNGEVDGPYTDIEADAVVDAATLTVERSPPEVALSGPQRVDEGSTHRLVANATGDDLGYDWSVSGSATVDDGLGPSPTDGRSVPVAFGDAGRARVSVTVTDGDGRSSTAERTVTVEEVRPTVAVDVPDRVEFGDRATLTVVPHDPADAGDLSVSVETDEGVQVLDHRTEYAAGAGDVRRFDSYDLAFFGVGPQELSVTVSDGDGNTVTVDRTVQVQFRVSPVPVPGPVDPPRTPTTEPPRTPTPVEAPTTAPRPDPGDCAVTTPGNPGCDRPSGTADEPNRPAG
jgi:hypothetical protein